MTVKVIRQEGASCVDGFIAKAGKLTLTSEALSFEFRQDDADLQTIEVSLMEVDKVDYFKTLSIIPNGLTIFLRNGDMKHFVVDDRVSWQRSILDARNKRLAKD
jgi:hypothetical protein